MGFLLRFLVVLTCLALFTGFPPSTSADASTVYLSGFPRYHQQHALTCESSAVSMATRGKITEGQIMALLPRHPNPNVGFRGNPDGRQGPALKDYGVYAQPLHQALLQYGYRSTVIMYGSDDLIASYINRGWPVITWITYALQPAVPRLAQYNGVQFFLVPHEHAILVVGYDDNALIANDPATGKQVAYDWQTFNRAWGYFANMALAVEPCPEPEPVAGLHASLTTAGLRWKWGQSANAARYQFKLTLPAAGTTVAHRVQTGRTFTLASPVPGATYEFVITSISPCGSASQSVRLGFQVPSTLPPTPSLTPSPAPTGQVPSPEPTATPTRA